MTPEQMLRRAFVPPTQRLKNGNVRKKPIFHPSDAPVLRRYEARLNAALTEVKGEPAEAALYECIAILKDAATFVATPPPEAVVE